MEHKANESINHNTINTDETCSSQSISPDSLVSNWNYQKGLLQHIIDKTRARFLSSDKVNEFPQCTWFEEDDLLFDDTMTESSANVNNQCEVGDIDKLEETISKSLIELNEIVVRMISLTECEGKHQNSEKDEM